MTPDVKSSVSDRTLPSTSIHGYAACPDRRGPLVDLARHEPLEVLRAAALGGDQIGADRLRALAERSRRSLHDARVPPVDSVDDPPPGSILHADPGSKFRAD